MHSPMARARSGGFLLLLLGGLHSYREAFLSTTKPLSNKLHRPGCLVPHRRLTARSGTVMRRALSPEQSVRRLLKEWPDNPDNDDRMELTGALKKLPGVSSKDAFAQLAGNWKVEWSR